jgi:hypothetical protein
MLEVGRLRVRFHGEATGFLNWTNPSSRSMAVGSTPPLTEMGTRNFSAGGGGDGRTVVVGA